VLEDISLDIRAQEIFTLIGPSGSGKTTLLRLIDLLDPPASGTILFDGQDTAVAETGRLSLRRRMAMVFQKPAVLNTTVAKNIAFGLKFRGIPPAEAASRVESALGLVGLPAFASRRAITLSGGEMQRVAIARAMVTRPELLILDEPTANLDPVSSALIEDLILRIRQDFGTTVIIATHDMIQGQRLADRIGVIMDGRLVQTGVAEDIFYRPAERNIARFVGTDVIPGGIVIENREGHAVIRVREILFEALTNLEAGRHVLLFIRPEEVSLALAGGPGETTSVRNRFLGTVTRLVPSGPFIRVTVDCGILLAAIITRRSASELGLDMGSRVIAGVKASAIHILPE